jgi:D-glycero-D-manno-heptose 1,7-bisphosphate phosphatase
LNRESAGSKKLLTNENCSQMKLIILDRDGVINQDADGYIKSVDEWTPIPGSLEAIARLQHTGYKVAVATNQSGLARGLFTIDDLNAMHKKMQRELGVHGGQVEAIFFCPHGPNEGCYCRKPSPGLLIDISERLQTSLKGTPVIGDSYRDIKAARTVGAFPILVRTGKGIATLANHKEQLSDIPVYADLAAAATAVLEL